MRSSMNGPDPRRRVWPGDSLVAVAYLAVAVAITWPVVSQPGGFLLGETDWPGALPDNDVNCFLWAFWWFRQAWTEGVIQVFHTPYMAHPSGLSLITTPITPLWALLSVPFQGWFSLVAIYNTCTVLMLAGSAFFAFLLARDLQRIHLSGEVSRAGPFLCGCAFGFLPFHAGHWIHLNLLSTLWAPATVWAFGRAVRPDRGGWGWAVAAGVALAAQAWTSWYLMVFLVLLLAGIAVALARREVALAAPVEQRRLDRALWGAVAAAFVLSNLHVAGALLYPAAVGVYGLLVATAWGRRVAGGARRMGRVALALAVAAALTAPMFLTLARETARERVVEQTDFMASVMLSVGPESHLMPQRWVVALDRRVHGGGPADGGEAMRPDVAGGEFAIFAGYVLWALVVVVWAMSGRRGRRRQGVFWLVLAGVFMVLSLGPALWVVGRPVPWLTRFDTVILPAIALQMLPVVSGLRAMARFAVLVPLALSAFVACNVGAVLPRRPGRRWLVVGALAAALLVERFPGRQPAGAVRSPEGFAPLAQALAPEAVVLGLPLDRAALMMFAQTAHGRRMVNFFGARVSRQVTEPFQRSRFHRYFRRAEAGEAPEQDGAAAAMADAELRRLGVSAIVVHRAVCEAQCWERYEAAIVRGLGWALLEETAEYGLFGPESAFGGENGDLSD